MKYQGIIFDFNGTLFFDSHYHNQVWKEIAKELRGYELSDEEMNTGVHGKNNEKVIDYICNGTLTREENKQISLRKEKKYRDMVKDNPSTSVLAPGVIEFLDDCKKQHIPMTIATASIKENVDFYISYFHLDRWIDPKTVTYDDGSYEDKVAMFKQAAKNLGTDIQECLVFEDSNSGIQFAHKAGAKGIIAIDSICDEKRYAAFTYLEGIYQDFSNITVNILK